MSFVKRFQTSLESLYSLSKNASYVVAYSGGVDSHVLLFCCIKLKLSVRAVHIHHGLHNIADDWVEHCQTICSQLNIPLDVIYVNAQQKRGTSPEESARNARYDALKKNLSNGDCLITAQHKNDQAETLLLQLFRTAGTAGLSAMPEYRQFGKFAHIRPLLNFSRKEIEDFAEEKALHWIEDPSNQDTSFDRNFIRKNILPLLEKRWSKITTQLSIVARLQFNNLQVLEDMAAIDLANVTKTLTVQSKPGVYNVVSLLSVTALKQLSSARLLNVLRYWIIRAAKNQPTRNLLEEIEKTLIYSQQGAKSIIVFSGFEFRKYQDNLYLLHPKLNQNVKSNIQIDLDWNPLSAITMPQLHIRLTKNHSFGEGLKQVLLEEPLKIRFRKGGEYFHPAGRQHSQSLKKLLQEASIPPWERDSIPLLYFKDELIAVIGLWVCKKYAVDDNEEGWVVDIEEF
jgi:tRNA(Ile)-lysidine synthase